MNETAELVNKIILGLSPTIMIIASALATWRIWIHGMGVMNAKNPEAKKEQWTSIYIVLAALAVVLLAGTIVLVLKNDIVNYWATNTVFNSNPLF